MFRKSLFKLLTISLIFSASLSAQLPPAPPSKLTDKETIDAYWSADLPGGEYFVELSKITSVSHHKYLLDGAAIVDEVTVDSLGQALARFYFITPLTEGINTSLSGPGMVSKHVQELSDKVSERTGTDLQNMVVKKYPETTHAKSIEYRLLSAVELNGLYNSVKNAWISRRGHIFSITPK
jgi:hypothetical protein